MLRWMIVGLALAWCVPAPAVAQAPPNVPFQHPLKDSDGDPIANFDLAPALQARLAKLPGQVPVGNLAGDVTLIQFYDLNCPFCREAAHDVDALVRADRKLKLVLVPYAILSVQSVQGGMVEMAVAKQLSPEKYLDFHRRIYEFRGTIDGPKALAAAKDFGLDPNAVAAAANTEATLQTLRDTADFGMAANLLATPAYVIGGVVVLGHPGEKPLQGWIKAMRTCGKVLC